METFPLELLKKWFQQEKRELPWRETVDPYAIWVSEVMLQQTQVAVVIPFFKRWMERFPNVETLAQASAEEVLKHWEGLGYYSRARNLHEGAKYVLNHYNGYLPDNACDLKKIKGLGDYTVGAILNFAFHQKAVALDGNVMRVMARFFGIADDISRLSTQKTMREKVACLLPDHESWIVSEALIELGATHCSKKPRCPHCPLSRNCSAYQQNLQTTLPFKSMKIKTEYLKRMVALIRWNNFWLVRKVPKGKIMSDLYEFPYFEIQDEHQIDHFELIKKDLGLEAELVHVMDQESHSFTRYQVSLFPYLFKTGIKPEVIGYQWLTVDQLIQLPFSSGHRRIFEKIKTQIW